MRINVNHSILNSVNRITLKPALTYIPFHRRLVNVLPTALHMGDFLAEWAFGCNIKQFKLDHMGAEWVYKEENKDSKNAILFLHGGGYIAFDPITHRAITTYLAKINDVKILAINYRKAPEFKFPSQINDAIHAYDYLIAQGYDPKNITFMGDSAGGNLATVTVLRLIQLGRELPSCVCLMSPWTDLTISGSTHKDHTKKDCLVPHGRLKKVARMYAGWHPLHDPLISPIFADFTGFPPLMIHVGNTELLLDDARRLADAAKKSGCDVHYKEWENGSHVFQAWTQVLPDARRSLREFSQFMNSHWSSTR